MSRSAVLLLALALGLALPAASPAASTPKGAVKLKSADQKTIRGVACGRIKGKWLPGKRLARGYFLSHAAQVKTLKAQAKKAKKAKKAKLNKQIKALQKKAKSQGAICLRPSGGGTTPGTTGPGGGPVTGPTYGGQGPLRFRLSGATGVALKPMTARRAMQQTTGSNMAVVQPGGTIADAVSSGTARISRFHIAPNNKLYVAFQQQTNLENSGAFGTGGCILAEIATATGVPTCIDDQLTQILVPYDTAQNPIVQFDSTGAIYYAGRTNDGKTILRRFLNGARKDLINDAIDLRDFLVRPDGSVFLTGMTTATGQSWTRRVTPEGALTTVRQTPSNFLKVFPDGNVYMGMWNTGNFGIRRFVTESNAVEDKYWLSGPVNGQQYTAYHEVGNYCGGGPSGEVPAEGWASEQFCGTYGTFIKGAYRTLDDKMFVLAGRLMQYYPSIAQVQTQVKKATVGQGVISNIVVAGLNAADQNILTIYNTSNSTETLLLGPDRETEVYHVNYVASQNRVLFDGLRFSDNTYVLGQVDMSTGEVTMSPSGGVKWDDFQTFG